MYFNSENHMLCWCLKHLIMINDFMMKIELMLHLYASYGSFIIASLKKNWGGEKLFWSKCALSSAIPKRINQNFQLLFGER